MTFFVGFQLTVFENKWTFMKKNLFCIQPLWRTAKPNTFFTICLVLTKEMAHIWHLWQELLKSTSKILKTWRHQLYSNGRFEPLANSARSLTWAYKLKALKSSSHISAKNWLKIFLIHVITCDTSLRWRCWSSLSLPCVLILMQCVWFAGF